MAVPKKRKSHSRVRMQRSHQALKVNGWVTCAQCGELTALHQVCGSCGFYRSKEVISKEN
ncbi:MAG: 50S ribosomal protein L32 [Myxococcota bacterium]|jgi:large subunit ribosomal protein L32|nr:50S ribosomal protein L32 [Myxococcota bacterium]